MPILQAVGLVDEVDEQRGIEEILNVGLVLPRDLGREDYALPVEERGLVKIFQLLLLAALEIREDSYIEFIAVEEANEG